MSQENRYGGSRMGQWHDCTVEQEISFPEVSLFSRVPLRTVCSIFQSDPDWGLVNVQEPVTRERSLTKLCLSQICRYFVEIGQWVQRVKQNTYEARIWVFCVWPCHRWTCVYLSPMGLTFEVSLFSEHKRVGHFMNLVVFQEHRPQVV